MPYLKLKLSAPESVATTEKIAVVLTELTADILKKKRALTALEIVVHLTSTLVHRWRLFARTKRH